MVLHAPTPTAIPGIASQLGRTLVKVAALPGRKRRSTSRLLVAATFVAALLTPIEPATAAFPGTNGKIAFMSDRGTSCPGGTICNPFDIYVMNPDGSGQTRLTTAPSSRDPAWSPDGQRIAFWSTRDGNAELYVMNADGSGQQRLTANGASDLEPAWSPDGTRLAFRSDRDGNTEVYVMNADGSGQQRLTTNAAFDAYPAWSPAGDRIAFYSNRDGNFELYLMNPDGSGQTRLTTHPSTDAVAAWSPDGTRLAFQSNRDGNAEIYVMNADGSGPARLTTNAAVDTVPAWSPDGARITFHSERSGTTEVWVMGASGANVTQLTAGAFSQGNAGNPDWQPVPAPVTLSSLAVTPADPTLPKGTERQFTATGRYSNGTTADLTGSVTWASGNDAVATIDSGGLAHAVAVGTAGISATQGTVSGSTTLTVGPAALTALAVTPANPSIPNGTDQQFTATGTFTDDSTAEVTADVTWTSEDPAVATIGSTGLAHALATGASIMTASSAGISGTTTLTVTAQFADLAVTLTDSPDPALAGQPITYTITTGNVGPSTATAVTVTDTLPAGVVFLSGETSRGVDCAAAAGTVTCPVGTLEPAAAVTSTVTVTTTDTGSVTNTATAVAEQTDPTPADATATVTTTVTAAADLNVTISDSPDPVLAGQDVSYTAAVTNRGPSTGTEVTLTATWPAEVTFRSATASAGTCSAPVAGRISCALGSVGVGATATVTIKLSTSADGPISLSATAAANEGDPTPADASASETTTVTAAVDLAVTMADSPDPVPAGQPVLYTITVTNRGPSIATGVELIDTVAGDYNMASAVPSQGSGCTATAATIHCELGQLNVGVAATVEVTVRFTTAGFGTNTAAASATQAEVNPADNQVSETTAVLPAANLAVTVADSADPVLPRESVAYTITVTNHGPSIATGARIAVTVDGFIASRSFATTRGSCALDGTVVRCDFGTLAVNSTVVVTVTVIPFAEGTLTAGAAAAADQADPAPENNLASETTTVRPSADLTVTIADNPDPVAAGQFLTYTLTVTNAGPSFATGVTLVHPLSSALTFHTATVSGGSGGTGCSTSQAQVLSCGIGALAAGGSALVSVLTTARIAGPMAATATVSGAKPDPVIGNNSAIERTTVLVANGRIAFSSARTGNAEIYTMNPDGGSQTRLTFNSGADLMPTWSPDGRRIAFTSVRGSSAFTHIYIMNADGSGVRAITSGGGFHTEPSWSPDGTKLAFTSNRDGNYEIYVVNPDGTGLRRLTLNNVVDSDPAWSPNGGTIALASAGEIMVINADGSGLRRLTARTGLDISPSWSPDGARIAFASNFFSAGRVGSFDIWVMNADGSSQARVVSDHTAKLEPAWSPDGTKIAFTRLVFANSPNIAVMNADGTGLRALTTTNLDASPAWQRIG